MPAPSFLTVLITDLAAPAALYGGRGDDAADALRREHFATLRACVDAHQGREVKSIGDGLMVVFPSAVEAVRCAVAMQRATTAAVPSRPMRVGIDAGEPVADGDDVYGRPVIVAGRLCDAAADGEILVSDIVRQLAEPRAGVPISRAGTRRLRGIDEPVATAVARWEGDAEAGEPHGAVRPVTVVVADDQRLLRAGFRVILDAEPDLRVIGEAGDGRAAVDVVRRRRPDVVLMDIRMPELDGLSAAERILGDPELHTAVVMLTTFDANEYVFKALRIGASGFLLKDTPSDRLLDAVRVAAAGDALISPSITRRLIGEFTRAARPLTDEVPPVLAELTARELDVLRLVARGLSNGEIASELTLGENTIKTHVGRVLAKLGLRDRVQAVVLAYESGLVARDG